MKNQLKSIATLILASVLVMSLNGCKKKKEEAEVVPLGKATISGRLTADLDYNNAVNEPVSGVVVNVKINTYDLVTNPDWDVTYPDKVYTTTTDANGNYSIDIEVGAHEVEARVIFTDFTYDVVQVTPATPATQRTVFQGWSQSVDIYQNGVIVIDGTC